MKACYWTDGDVQQGLSIYVGDTEQGKLRIKAEKGRVGIGDEKQIVLVVNAKPWNRQT
jgi:hypothetical protein